MTDLYAELGRIAAASEAAVVALMATFARVSAVVFLAPGLGERTVPIRVRLIAAVALTVVVAPVVLQDFALVEATGLIAIPAEFLSGLMLGILMRMFVMALSFAGALIGQSLSLSQLFGPTVGFEAGSPFESILVSGGLALAVAGGLHFEIAGALIESYTHLPFGTLLNPVATAEWSLVKTGQCLQLGLSLASPFIVLGFVYALALAAASRAMPQLMASFVGAPAVTLAGLIMFASTAIFLLAHWINALSAGVAEPFGGVH